MPRRARLTVVLSLRQILDLQGLPPLRRHKKRLQRYLESRERCTGANFLQRLSNSPNAPLVATLADLRRYCPGLFDRREEAVDMLRESIEELRQDALEGKARDKALASRLRELRGQLRELQARSKVVQSGPPPGQG